jgi:hypothetical protein
MHFIRETPWYVFYPLVFATLGCIAMLFQLLRKASLSKQAVYKEARWIARRLAQGRYYLKGKMSFPWGISIELETADLDRKKEVVVFFSKHPDYEQFKKLGRLEVIEFEFSETAHRRVGKDEICAYLKLKDA